MTVPNHVVASAVSSRHTARFFDTDESRVQSVASFLTEGYKRGEALIIIARPHISSELQRSLTSVGVAVDEDVAAGRIIFEDAHSTLKKICTQHGPSPFLFNDAIGTLVRTAVRSSVVRAYGEMVDILAQRRDFTEVLALEKLWNTFLRMVPLNLLCGYNSAHFVAAGMETKMSEICAIHDHIEMASHDQLGTWLLGNAGIQPKAN